MTNLNKDEVLRKLEELLALDNSDKEYLVETLLRDRDIKNIVGDKLSQVVDNLFKQDNNQIINTAIQNIIEASFAPTFNAKMDQIKNQISAIANNQVASSYTIMEEVSKDFANKVENKLNEILHQEVSTHLFEILSNKNKKE